MKELLLESDLKTLPGLDRIRVNVAAVCEKLLRELKLVQATTRRTIEFEEGEDAMSARFAAGTSAMSLCLKRGCTERRGCE